MERRHETKENRVYHSPPPHLSPLDHPTTRNSRRLRDLRLNDLHNTRIRQRAQIAQLIRLTRDDLPHDPSHDLPRTGLRKVAHDVHFLRRREGADDFADLDGEFFRERGFVGGVVFEFAVGG